MPASSRTVSPAYRESGVTVLNVQPVGPNGLKDIETIANWVA